MTRPRLSIAVVNYNSGYRLSQCIDSIAENKPSCSYEVIVVDNASRDGSADFLRKRPRPAVQFIDSPANLLWTGGVNLAFARSSGEYFLILNPDHIVLPGAFDALVRHLDEDATLGGIGGYTLNLSGQYEPYVRGFPRPMEVFLSNTGLARLGPRRRRRPLLDGIDVTRPFEVPDAMSGCAIIRSALFKPPLLDPRFGVFWSDAELARNIHARGARAMVFPDAQFIHDHDHEARRVRDPASLRLVLDYLVGCQVYFRKFGGGWEAVIVKVLFVGSSVAALSLKHVPRALVGREPWPMLRARARMVGDVMLGRNRLLAEAREGARQAGLHDAFENGS